MSTPKLNLQSILSRLKEHEVPLRGPCVTHVALFGSRARDDGRPGSDTDILVEIDPDAHIGVWGFVGVRDYIAALFDGPADVANRAALRAFVAPSALVDAIYSF